jgi:2-C-methyl-D-erythritol 2,4-cyclodiphosphate synthase
LAQVGKLIEHQGYVLGNLDSIVVAQKPKISPYIEKMRENIAEILGTDKGRISVKATTTERLGLRAGKKASVLKRCLSTACLNCYNISVILF